ncbi:hypothetical protein RvY_12907 [Ramazzottius varieornatus]|uniref:Medium-chain acyl-CoA ligase ACSF2, mitochondrial n=1 Tax=Ramazzottius varieornatus TaxID=947166 RepID=A0A1D1VTM7_RAMVA|nr:hypothetical protein RvY_12907 [Ramazzottius varieornatus]
MWIRSYRVFNHVCSWRMARLHAKNLSSLSQQESIRSKLKKSYVNGASATPLVGHTIGDLIDMQAEQKPDQEAFVFPAQNIRKSYGDLKQDVDGFAAGLLKLGMQPRDRVGIWSPNAYEWVVCAFGAAKAGLVLVLVNPGYKSHELEYCLNKVQVKTLVAAEGMKSLNYYQMLTELNQGLAKGTKSNRTPHLEHIVMTGQKVYPGTLRFEDVGSSGNKENYAKLEQIAELVQFDDPANIQFTSGTTGNPKGATLTHHNIVNNGYFGGRRFNFHQEKDTRICCPVPLYHCFGWVLGSLCALSHGVCIVYPEGKFDAEATLKAIHNEKCTTIYGVPTMFSDMLYHPDFHKFDTSSLRSGLMSGAPCPVELVKKVRDKMKVKNILVGYGMTETSPLSHVSFLGDPAEYVTSTVGRAMDHVETKIVDAGGRVVPIGTPGEILTRGYNTFLGYWEEEQKTKEAVTETGWNKSGDIGVMNENGYVRIVGRSKDVIIRGGENVYPAEVESCLHHHPSVVEAYVVGVPDDRLGEETCAWIRPRKEVTEKELKDFCGAELASFKVPRYFVFLEPDEAFPLTVTGKVQKFILREKSITRLKLDGVQGPFAA